MGIGGEGSIHASRAEVPVMAPARHPSVLNILVR